MPFNMHAGYGRLIAESLASRRPHTGKLYFVATSTLAGWEEFSEMFPTGPEGNTRVWTTLKGLLDADMIEDGGDDIVLVLPNHTETIKSAGAIDIGTDSAGLTILGLGNADERPLFTFTTAATADIDIGSNGVTFENLRFDLTGVDELAAPIDVNDSGCTIKDCEFTVADSGGQAVLAILTDANASNMKVQNCKFYGSTNAGTTAAIRIVGGDGIEIIDNVFIGAYTTTVGAIQNSTTAATNLLIRGNVIRNITASSTDAIDLMTGATGSIVNNRMSILSGTAPIGIVDGANAIGLVVGGNYYVATTGVAAGTLL